MADAKADLRQRAIAVRDAAAARHGSAMAGERLAALGLEFLAVPPKRVVAGFMAIGGEIDPMPLMLRLAGEGHALSLPVMVAKGTPLVFRAYVPGEGLQTRMWGIREPLADRPEVAPDVLLVPLLAVDAAGWRLGYGGGFYDRTLAGLRAAKSIIAVGIGYDEQVVDAVPHLDYDEPLDWVLTPSGPVRCRRS